VRLDIVRRFVARDGPSISPVPRWFDASCFQPQLERLGDNHRTGSVGRRRHIHERYEFTGKRNADLTEIRSSHDTTVSQASYGFKRSVPHHDERAMDSRIDTLLLLVFPAPVDPSFGGASLQRTSRTRRATSVLRGQFILAAIRMSAITDNFSQIGVDGQVRAFSVSYCSVLLP